MIGYDNFNLRLVADGCGFQVLADSPGGSAVSPLELDVASTSEAWAASRDPSAVRAVGARLFSGLLHRDVRRLFDRSLGALLPGIDRGLRLRILLDPRDPRLRELAALPWELLYCADARAFVSLDPRTPIVRSLDALQPTHAPHAASPLRVLLVTAQPRGVPDLDLAAEGLAIESACQKRSGTRVAALAAATLEALRRRLVSEQFDIVHFMGHGHFEERSGEGTLLLESAGGDAHPVSAQTLAVLWQGRSKPTLVVLNACDTARSTCAARLDPFAGVAAALVGEGIPAVLAMRASVYDDDAVTFSSELYARIAAGDTLDAAVVEARRALYMAADVGSEWAVPILFARPSLSAVALAEDSPTGGAPIPSVNGENDGAAVASTAPVQPAPRVRRRTELHQNLNIGEVGTQHVYQAHTMSFGQGRSKRHEG